MSYNSVLVYHTRCENVALQNLFLSYLLLSNLLNRKTIKIRKYEHVYKTYYSIFIT